MNASARIAVSEVVEEVAVKKTKEFDKLEFRKALGSFPTGVTIISARNSEGRPFGVTCSSFNSVSLDPPLVLWSLAKNSYSRAAFEATPNWAVNLLSSDQETLSNKFARAGNDKFADVETDVGIAGVPLLTGCCARFQCATEFVYEGGDHIILVGRVLAFDRSDRLPLVFHSGQYNRQIADAVARALGMRTRHLLDWA
jgi:3-hydroxy-9,10-secoandrosta-1,3,5(10)-triene-9,17-dione monooxygenase reductase component